MDAKLNLPESFDTWSRLSFVWSLTSVTLAPATTAPFGSVTEPEMLPVTDWAKAGELMIIAAERPSTRLVKRHLILSTEGGRNEALWLKLNMVVSFFWLGGETPRGLLGETSTRLSDERN